MTSTTQPDIESLLDDRVDEGIFRVHRDAFLSPEVFDLEIERIFESNWVYVGHESQVPNPHDFITTNIGRQPVLVTRDAEGGLNAFLNSCRHRGMMVTTQRSGSRRTHTCRYHGWVYDSAGRNINISQRELGRYSAAFDQENHDLVPVAKFGNYRGFLFASLSPNVPTLDEHLGEARVFLDLIVDQAPNGLEFVPGSTAYTFNGNWKLQIENGLDMYHFSHVHVSYVELLQRREKSAALGGPPPSPSDEGEQGTFSFGRGHAVMWRSKSRASKELLEHRAATFGANMSETMLRWSTYGRNLTIFPNLQIVDNLTSMMLRVINPLSPDCTEMQTRCLAPVGESPTDRTFRIRDYEDFFNPSGLATPDDNVVYEHSQAGLNARAAGWTAGYARGIDRTGLPETSPYAKELNLTASEWIHGPRSMGDETCFHDAYREWKRLLSQPPGSPNNH